MVSDERRLQLNREYFSHQVHRQWQAYTVPRPRPWQSLLRTRQASALATIRGHLSPPATVLDIGCGTGGLAVALAEDGYQVTAIDLVEEMISEGRRACSRVKWVHAPFADGVAPRKSFDVVVALGYLEYQERSGKELVRMGRLLKPGGLLILSVPNTLSGQFVFGATRAVFRLGKEPEGFQVRHTFTPERLQRHLGMAGYILMDYEWLGPESPTVILGRDRQRPFWSHRIKERFRPEMLTLSRTYRPSDTAIQSQESAESHADP